MFKDYSTYQASNFLIDDYFVDSMFKPTSESEDFWKLLIDDNKIKVDEFISAYLTVKGLHYNNSEIPTGRIDMLWNRISKTNQEKISKIKPFQFMRYATVACCIIGVAGFSFITLIKTGKFDPTQSISEITKENIL